MRTSFRRILVLVAVFAVACIMGPLVAAGPASALPPGTARAGSALPNPASGTGTSTFVLNLTNVPSTGGAAFCPHDSTGNFGERVTFFITPVSQDPATLTFNAQGTPTGAAGTLPLRDSGGTPIRSQVTSPAPDNFIDQSSTLSFSQTGTIATGVYYVGAACYETLDGSGGAVAAPYASDKYYASQVTFSNGATWTYSNGGPASAPTGVTQSAGNQQCTATFTGSVSDPANTGYTASATPTGGGSAITNTGAGSPITITGLTNNTSYNIAVFASNGVQNSAPVSASNNPCTPVAGARNNVRNLAANAPAPGATSVDLQWDEPNANTPAALPVSYTVAWTGPASGNHSVTYASGTGSPKHYTDTVSGLTGTGIYTFTVTAIYSDAPTSGTPPQSVQASISPSTLVDQVIDVTRPVGALVLTQVCNSNGAVPGVANGAPGFPTGSPATAANHNSTVGSPAAVQAGDTPGTGFTPKASKNAPGTITGADPNRAGYPYPTNPDGTVASGLVYPTYCGVNLGAAQFVTRGIGSGQYFATTGVMDQVTIVDTRDGNTTGWSATGVAGQFSDGVGDTFSSKTLGWTPQVSDQTGPFDDGNGNTYTPNPAAGASVDPGHGVSPTDGLSVARPLASATNGLGTTIVDARLVLLIPVTADAALYESILTVSVA